MPLAHFQVIPWNCAEKCQAYKYCKSLVIYFQSIKFMPISLHQWSQTFLLVHKCNNYFSRQCTQYHVAKASWTLGANSRVHWKKPSILIKEKGSKKKTGTMHAWAGLPTDNHTTLVIRWCRQWWMTGSSWAKNVYKKFVHYWRSSRIRSKIRPDS